VCWKLNLGLYKFDNGFIKLLVFDSSLYDIKVVHSTIFMMVTWCQIDYSGTQVTQPLTGQKSSDHVTGVVVLVNSGKQLIIEVKSMLFSIISENNLSVDSYFKNKDTDMYICCVFFILTIILVDNQ
jgi:hypothetical protein